MASNKDNNPNSFGGPSPSSKLAKSAKDLKILDAVDATDAIDYPACDGLDNIVTGGCSTCGSLQHATVKCDRKDVPPEYLMSGALPPDTEYSTCASSASHATATPAVKDAQANSGTRPGQGIRRRHSA